METKSHRLFTAVSGCPSVCPWFPWMFWSEGKMRYRELRYICSEGGLGGTWGFSSLIVLAKGLSCTDRYPSHHPPPSAWTLLPVHKSCFSFVTKHKSYCNCLITLNFVPVHCLHLYIHVHTHTCTHTSHIHSYTHTHTHTLRMER